MCPIIVKVRDQHYVPWSFCDMTGLANRLSELTGGANKWITALEENIAGVKLALGDIKASMGFNAWRNAVWAELRKKYPEKMDPSKLEGGGEDECPAKFLNAFQRKWREETGEAWNGSPEMSG